MKKGISTLLLCITSFIISGCSHTKDVRNEYNLVPRPNSITPHEGRFALNNQVQIATANCSDEVKNIAEGFIKRINLTSGISLKHADGENAPKPVIRFKTVDNLEKEAYQLRVTPTEITIMATQPNGFFYAIQTIYQLLPADVYGQVKNTKAEWTIPAVDIKDSPRFSYRGMHLDPCRHFADIDYVYKYIDLLAMHKMNIFHFHLTDDQGWRIEIKKYPRLTEVGAKRKETLIDYYYVNYPQIFDGKEHSGHYTQEQIKDIVAYAADRYITVIPEIEMPGHAVAALAAYPELSCDPKRTYQVEGTWGVFNEIFCPKEETFKFLEDVMDEVIELFPSPYIHVGGDEAPKTAWKNCQHCQALIKKLGLKDDTTPNAIDGIKHTKEEKLQSYFITRMEKYINAKGRNIIGWDEILEGGLAPNATVMSWRGVEGGMNAAKAGHDAIMTPNPYAYLDHYQEEPDIAPTTIGGYNTLKKTYSYNPVPDDADPLVKKHIIGLQGNVWAEYIQTPERRDYQAFPRAVAIAETGWTLNENKNWADFCRRMVGDFQRLDIMNVAACRNFFDVNINTRVIEGELKVMLESFYPEADIYYTLDGTEPTTQSALYTKPFAWEGKAELCAAAFKNGRMLGKVSNKDLYANLISGKKYTVTPQTGGAKGDTFDDDDVLGADPTTFGLTNGKRGNIASYNPWSSFGLGKDKNAEVVFTVDMEKAIPVNKVVFGSLYNPAYRVLPPSAAIVELSTDGETYTEVARESFTRQYPEHGRKMFTDELTFASTEARYVKVRLQSGGLLRNKVDCFVEDAKDELVSSNIYLDEVEVYNGAK